MRLDHLLSKEQRRRRVLLQELFNDNRFAGCSSELIYWLINWLGMVVGMSLELTPGFQEEMIGHTV